MSECTCHKNYTLDTLIPKVGVITDIREETPDVKTFRVNAPEGGKLFEHMPGQCAMLCAPGISEGMFSITSSPTNKEYQEFSIKKCGMLTDYLHSLEVGDEITVRGPYGNHFPVEDKLKGYRLRITFRRRSGSVERDPGSMDERSGCPCSPDHRPRAGRMGRPCGIRAELCEGAWLRCKQDGADLRTSDHDQVHAGRTGRTGILQRSGLHDAGAAYEMRHRQVRQMQHRIKICM